MHMVDERYSVHLVARNEGIQYVDDNDVYRFNVALINRVWKLHLPCTKGSDYEVHVMSEEEEARILPRIIRYLEMIKWFGFFPVRYSVVVERNKLET
jgi:hypothetical protein